jgi:hypothetical protein
VSRITDLSTAYKHLAAAAPLEFSKLKEAAAAYYAEQTTALVNSAPEDLSRMQGRAQTASLLLSMLESVSKGAN